jgi:hypothetical protein
VTGRQALEPGGALALGTLRVTLVSVAADGARAVLRIGEGRCAREVTVGPDPVPVGGHALSLAPESGAGRAVLVIG